MLNFSESPPDCPSFVYTGGLSIVRVNVTLISIFIRNVRRNPNFRLHGEIVREMQHVKFLGQSARVNATYQSASYG
jgi:hypothetical protein